MNLFVGGRYNSKDGFGLRVIEQIHGDDIHWRDNVGPGRCSRSGFERWVGAMSPDSPPSPPASMKRSKPITDQVIQIVLKDLAQIQRLREMLADLKMDPNGTDMIGPSAWCLGTALKLLENGIEELPRAGRRGRAMTRIDARASLSENAIGPLIAVLNDLPEAPAKSDARQLTGALSDGLVLISRLRLKIAPYIAQ